MSTDASPGNGLKSVIRDAAVRAVESTGKYHVPDELVEHGFWSPYTVVGVHAVCDRQVTGRRLDRDAPLRHRRPRRRRTRAAYAAGRSRSGAGWWWSSSAEPSSSGRWWSGRPSWSTSRPERRLRRPLAARRRWPRGDEAPQLRGHRFLGRVEQEHVVLERRDRHGRGGAVPRRGDLAVRLTRRDLGSIDRHDGGLRSSVPPADHPEDDDHERGDEQEATEPHRSVSPSDSGRDDRRRDRVDDRRRTAGTSSSGSSTIVVHRDRRRSCDRTRAVPEERPHSRRARPSRRRFPNRCRPARDGPRCRPRPPRARPPRRCVDAAGGSRAPPPRPQRQVEQQQRCRAPARPAAAGGSSACRSPGSRRRPRSSRTAGPTRTGRSASPTDRRPRATSAGSALTAWAISPSAGTFPSNDVPNPRPRTAGGAALGRPAWTASDAAPSAGIPLSVTSERSGHDPSTWKRCAPGLSGTSERSSCSWIEANAPAGSATSRRE